MLHCRPMNASFHPRACGDDAWRRWLHEAWILVRRGWGSWLPLQTLLMVSGACILGSSHSAITSLLVLTLMLPLFGVQLAAADTVARGTTSLTGLLDAVAEDVRRHAAAYARAAAIRGTILLGIAGLLLLSPPGDPPNAAAANPLMKGIEAWAFWWSMSHILRTGFCAGFLPYLRWKHNLPVPLAFHLETLAYHKNRRAIDALQLVFMLLLLVLLFVPWAVVVVEPLWAAAVRSAYADIFDDHAGIKDPKKQPVVRWRWAAARTAS